jgi:hypothetical protein
VKPISKAADLKEVSNSIGSSSSSNPNQSGGLFGSGVPSFTPNTPLFGLAPSA